MPKKMTKAKPGVKKFLLAGYNTSGVSNVKNPYYVDESFADLSRKQYENLYGKAQNFGATAAESNTEANRMIEARTKAKKADSEATKQAQNQELISTAEQGLSEIGTNIVKNSAGYLARAGASSTAKAGASLAGNAAKGAGKAGGSVVAGQATGLMGNMSGLAAAGIGTGLTVGGMLIENTTDDKNAATFTQKEKRGNNIGSAIKSAGKGFGAGAAIGSVVPGIGNVAGGVIGGVVGAGVGLLKARKENKDATGTAADLQEEQRKFDENERKRKGLLAEQSNELSRAYNTAFVNSRLMGMQSGFGYKNSTNMNMQSTGYETGGVKVPGGKIKPIPGSDAVKFEGRSHAKGGIRIDKHTEVEGGETMDKVTMSNGKPNDYFFSKYLKLGGKSFAQLHEQILKSGGSQDEIQTLARKQEAAANKKGEKDRNPNQVAAYGGIHKYQTAGLYKNKYRLEDEDAQESADAQSNKTAADVTVRDNNQVNANVQKDQNPVAPGGTTNNTGQAAADAASKATDANNTGTGSNANSTSPSNTPSPTSLFPEGKRAIKKDEYGTSTSLKGVPAGQHEGTKFYGNVTEQQYTDMQAANPWFDFTNFDPSNKTQVKAFQKSYNEHVRTGEKIKEDGKFGQQTVTARLYLDDSKEIPLKGFEDFKSAEPEIVKSTPALVQQQKKVEEQKQVADLRKGVNGSLLAGLGQLIPVGYGIANPYKAEGNLPRMEGGGKVGAAGIGRSILPRVNMNQERATSIANTVAINRAIQNQNAGPGAIAAMMAANAKNNDQQLAIANQEQEANKGLAGEESKMNMQGSMFNAEQANKASMVNAENQIRVNQANLEAGIQENKLKIEDKRYKREDTLAMLDNATSRIASIVKDDKSYKAQERLAKAIDNTNSYDRFKIKELLDNDPEYKNLTEEQKKSLAAKMEANMRGAEITSGGDENKLGGARKYTSRLGDLSKRNGHKNFKI